MLIAGSAWLVLSILGVVFREPLAAWMLRRGTVLFGDSQKTRARYSPTPMLIAGLFNLALGCLLIVLAFVFPDAAVIWNVHRDR
jgi:hypothetical protein